jgi:hypothetical protein
MENVTQRLQFGDQLLIVVDFAVEHHANALILVVERLLAGGQVDDREPAMAQADTRFEVQPPSSGPRWCCDSFIRERTRRSMSRRPRVSKIPVIPHIGLLQFPCRFFSAVA